MIVAVSLFAGEKESRGVDDAGVPVVIGGGRRCVVIGRHRAGAVGAIGVWVVGNGVESGGARHGDEKAEGIDARERTDRPKNAVDGHGGTCLGGTREGYVQERSTKEKHRAGPAPVHHAVTEVNRVLKVSEW